MRSLLVAIAAMMLSSCTAISFPIEGVPQGYFKEAESVQEVMTMIDEIPNKQCNKFTFMEGYPLNSLTEMSEMGRLHVYEGNPLLSAPAMAGVWPFGGGAVIPGKYGDVYEAHLYYLPDGDNHMVAHELMHAIGCAEESGLGLGFFKLFDGYTEAQKEIMKEEGVTKWIDTEFYKSIKEAQ